MKAICIETKEDFTINKEYEIVEKRGNWLRFIDNSNWCHWVDSGFKLTENMPEFWINEEIDLSRVN